ncbi:hypothetical protein FRC17_009279 [Serendipita sp. 399]|nr:hypothetical protein FRC17_009279 [Serendipita sp. 399]
MTGLPGRVYFSNELLVTLFDDACQLVTIHLPSILRGSAQSPTSSQRGSNIITDDEVNILPPSVGQNGENLSLMLEDAWEWWLLPPKSNLGMRNEGPTPHRSIDIMILTDEWNCSYGKLPLDLGNNQTIIEGNRPHCAVITCSLNPPRAESERLRFKYNQRVILYRTYLETMDRSINRVHVLGVDKPGDRQIRKRANKEALEQAYNEIEERRKRLQQDRRTTGVTGRKVDFLNNEENAEFTINLLNNVTRRVFNSADSSRPTRSPQDGSRASEVERALTERALRRVERSDVDNRLEPSTDVDLEQDQAFMVPLPDVLTPQETPHSESIDESHTNKSTQAVGLGRNTDEEADSELSEEDELPAKRARRQVAQPAPAPVSTGDKEKKKKKKW